MAPPTVPHLALLVASDGSVRAQLESSLAHIGCALEVIDAPDEARRAIAGRRPDVLLLDLAGRRRSALALLLTLRASVLTATLPVVVLTGQDEESDIRDSLDAGADAYVVRPLKASMALACVRGLLSRAHVLRKGSAAVRRTTPGLPGPRIEHDERDAFGRVKTAPRGLAPPTTREVLSSEWALFKAVQGAISVGRKTNAPLATVMMEVAALDPLPRREMGTLVTTVTERAAAALHVAEPLQPFEERVFCGVLPETDEAAAVDRVESVMRTVHDVDFRIGYDFARASVTFGVSILGPPFLTSPFKLIDCTRRALDHAKSLGGCGWWIAHPEPAPTAR
jgi:DNA-binding NarL/FixJ family response regulator